MYKLLDCFNRFIEFKTFKELKKFLIDDEMISKDFKISDIKNFNKNNVFKIIINK